jgi:hypothetical protein
MIPVEAAAARQHHVALHLAYRWFAFFETPGGDLDAHMAIFDPGVQLTGGRGRHLFARGHDGLRRWFANVPDALSSHHVVHSTCTLAEGAGLLTMVVAYQSPEGSGMHGSIISYEARIAFTPSGARFKALDKTPILPDTRSSYETSWSTNRVLARVHAELGGIAGADGTLRAALGDHSREVSARAIAPEGSPAYEALVTGYGSDPHASVRVLRLAVVDDVKAPLPQALDGC